MESCVLSLILVLLITLFSIIATQSTHSQDSSMIRIQVDCTQAYLTLDHSSHRQFTPQPDSIQKIPHKTLDFLSYFYI